ncbi:AMP-binding protein [Bradyrhizobium sp. CER78]|uniref:AMP-binding protein n=1 Tax=Bradyrhizobium sp. CER78 TaxID=3039162 RepID=UPI00244C9DA3|nr:AMP-binding protein [Bradyrhizobium sp. CER78]MDH2384394.1 AMP-binding protein [Bradyrhizobium sp. CER78]
MSANFDSALRVRAYEEAAGQLRARLGQTTDASPDHRRLTALDLFRAAPREAAALFYFDATQSYADIDGLSDRLAGVFARKGVGRGDRVAVILQNVPQFVIASVAAWKVGAIVVSLNPMYRTPELRKLFKDCEPKAVICHDDQWDNVVPAADSVDPELVLWTSAREFQMRNDVRVLPEPGAAPPTQALAVVFAEDASVPPPLVLTPDDIGLLLYTSGTTGVPKGAMLTHRNLVATALVCRDHFELNRTSRIFGVAPLFHITGFEIQMVAAFAARAAMVLTYRFQPQVALDAFLEWRPTFIIGAITAYIALMNQADATRRHFESFVHIYSGGAPIAPSVIDAFAERFGRAIRSSYGMTELTSASHLAPNEGPIPVDPASGALSIGRPTSAVDAIVVDDERHPLGPGEHGEVVVRGSGVMAGYWRKPVETDEVLMNGWLHSGDVGFFDESGWFYLVDRKKDMISASGFKVWPREVEDVIYGFPGVREAAVVGATDPYRGETVVAFVSARPGAAIDVAALSGFCRERLAAYKCPVDIRVLDDLPKTESGKITRNTLRDSLRSQ